ncbi:flagellar basal body-associated FliL family protein [Polycladidibacter hongkongensis]|uniref:flagellar basal body-associated FliL family protein n=1 Tax=Polycladidibacter hongkongensis TaxID=1647556 RepID=UPI00083305E4|nr:flagellar basal body-associated FliL family protein [Pseudovibrio hongkongensis]
MSEETPQNEETGAALDRRRKAMIVAAVLMALLTTGVGLAYVMGVFSAEPQTEDAAPAQEQKPVVFFDLPEMLVNLSSEGRTTYLKVRIALEVESDAMVEQIEPYLPRIMDAFQIYLRELRPSDLEGSAGLFRLKEQLLRRINVAVHPAKVDGVLFKEILIQ